MATSGRMTEAVASALGVPSGTVAVYVRHLREAGLIRQGARGRNAPHMQPLDIARVLISMLATDSPARAVDGARDFGALKFHYLSLGGGHPNIKLNNFISNALGSGHLFEDAVSSIVNFFCNPDNLYRTKKENVDHMDSDNGLPSLYLIVYESKGCSSIVIEGNRYEYKVDCSALGAEFSAKIEKEFSEKWFRGLQVVRSISSNELVALANALEAPRGSGNAEKDVR